MADSIKLNAFGKRVIVERIADQWKTFYLATDGKRRPANDIVIPSDLALADIPGYLDDLLHEWATAAYPNVGIID